MGYASLTIIVPLIEHPATRHVWITFLCFVWLSKASFLVGRCINREDEDAVASPAAGSAMFVEVVLTMEVPEVDVEDEEAVVLFMVDDEIMQRWIIIGEISSGGMYTSTW